jgi:hypothetical protein
MEAQQWLSVKVIQSRPRGIAKGSFSNYKSGQISFEPAEQAVYKPSKRLFNPVKSEETELKGIRTKREVEKNPIRQGEPYSDDPSFTPKPVRQRQQQESQIELVDNIKECQVRTARHEAL